jgi:hypothetical protein
MMVVTGGYVQSDQDKHTAQLLTLVSVLLRGVWELGWESGWMNGEIQNYVVALYAKVGLPPPEPLENS